MPNKFGCTPLHLAAGAGHLAVSQILIEHGANANIRDHRGMLPITYSTRSGHDTVTVFLGRLTYLEDDPNLSVVGSSSSDKIYFENNYQPKQLNSSEPEKYKIHNYDNNLETFDPKNIKVPSKIGDKEMTLKDKTTSDENVKVSSSYPSPELSSQLMHEAFSSLSLADKCAFSISLGHGNNAKSENSDIEIQSVLSGTDLESLDIAMSMMGKGELDEVESEVKRIQNNVRGWLLRKNYVNLRDAAKTLQLAWRKKNSQQQQQQLQQTKLSIPQGYLNVDKNEEQKSFYNINSPPLASTMDSKNSIPLDDCRSAETIPPNSGHDPTGGISIGSFTQNIIESKGDEDNQMELDERSVRQSNGSADTVVSTKYSSDTICDSHIEAAEMLQAVTRGMLARKSFSFLRRQTMASLIIQRGLRKHIK